MLHPQSPNQPHRSQAPTSITRRLSFLTWMLDFPALSVLPFFRHSIGFRVLSPGHYLGIAFLLIFAPTLLALVISIINGSLSSYTMGIVTLRQFQLPAWWMMEIFATVMLVLSFFKRRSAWLAFCDGKGTHTNSLGVSHLSSLFSIRPDRVNRVVDPIVCAVIGFVLIQITGNVLGLWLMFSGLALYLFEQRYMEWLLALQFDRHDAALLPQLQARLMADIKVSREKPPSPLAARLHELTAKVPWIGRERMSPPVATPLPSPTAGELHHE